MAAEKKRQTEIELRYSLDIQFSDLVDEVGFAITAGIFDYEGQRVLRRVIKRLMDARILFYKLDEPPPQPPPAPPNTPPRKAEFAPSIVEPTTQTTIH